jgi:hypothetical protein
MSAVFDQAQRVADSVLYEGYVLYPYRASAAKNCFRWQFGVVAPQSPGDDGEPSFAQTECIVDSRADNGARAPAPCLSIRVRFLRPHASDRESPAGRAWLDGVPYSVDLPPVRLINLPLTSEFPITSDGVDVAVAFAAESCGPFVKLRLVLRNRERWRAEFDANRDAMLERSLVGAHLLLAIDGGAFVSLLEPPPEAHGFVARCQNRHTWPVLAGDRTRRDLMLSSPIVLYDYPSVAAESRGDLCDAAEIDEILSLRILTMTDDEKVEARATDPRAREILDRVERLSPDELAALHGTMRSADFFNPPGTTPPDEAFVSIGAVRIKRGSHVRLRPNRRADSMDMFLRDQPATVAGVYRDVDDRVYVAVTVDADPAASLHDSFGRFFYFGPEEVEPVVSGEAEYDEEIK